MHSYIHFLIALTFLSVATAAWSLFRAHHLHLRIEARFPGFNDLMRVYGKRNRKP